MPSIFFNESGLEQLPRFSINPRRVGQSGKTACDKECVHPVENNSLLVSININWFNYIEYIRGAARMDLVRPVGNDY